MAGVTRDCATSQRGAVRDGESVLLRKMSFDAGDDDDGG